MLPIDFPYRNMVLGKPKDMTDEECSSLPVHYTGQTYWSKWRFNKEELEEINRTGGDFYLGITSTSHPVVCPMVESPFPEGASYVKPGDRIKAEVSLPCNQTVPVEGEIKDIEGLLVLSTAEGVDIPFYECKNAEFI